MPFVIHGLGTALPEGSVSQTDAAAIAESLSCETADQKRLLAGLYRRTGVERRHSVLLETAAGPPQTRQNFFPVPTSADDPGPTTAERMRRYQAEAAPLGERAATAAIAEAGCPRKQITHLVTVSCSGFAAPGWDIALIDRLGLPRDISRTHIGFMGCHGMLNGLRVASAFAQDPKAVVLVVAVELCSLHYRYGWSPDQIVSNALFADGAAAVIGTGSDSAASFVQRRLKEDAKPWSHAGSGSFIMPETTDAMTWTIGDHGFEMTLSARVPELIHRYLKDWLTGWLRDEGVSLEEVRSWAVHPGGPRIVGAVAESLGLPGDLFEVSRDVLREHGNMSSPTVLFLLERHRRNQADRPCVAIGFGPGLAIEAALFC